MNFHLLGGRRQKGIVREFGKVMYTLLYLKWITIKNLRVAYGVSVCAHSVCVQLSLSSWTVACQLLCPWNFPARMLEWVALSFSRGFSQHRDGTHNLLSVMWLPVRESGYMYVYG